MFFVNKFGENFDFSDLFEYQLVQKTYNEEEKQRESGSWIFDQVFRIIEIFYDDVVWKNCLTHLLDIAWLNFTLIILMIL